MAVASIPQWEASDLNTLQAQNKLSGIPAWALAGMDENESGGEVKGAGVNPQGYGGYFGESTSVIPANQLNVASRGQFDSQAQIVAAQLAGYNSPTGVLGDVAIYNVGGGGSNNGADWQVSQDAMDASALSSGSLSGSAPVGLSMANGGLFSGGGGSNPNPSSPTSSTSIGNPATAVGNAVTGALPWPFNSVANLFGINSAITDLFPFVIGFIGLLLIVWGISIVAKGSGVTVDLPSPGGGGSQKGGMAKDAEHGAEDAAVVAA